MEEDLEDAMEDVWKPVILAGGRILIVASLAVAWYSRLRKRLQSVSKREYLITTALPKAFERSAFIVEKLQQQLREALAAVRPLKQIQDQLHNTQLPRDRKLQLWESLKCNSLVWLLTVPFFMGVLVNAVHVQLALRLALSGNEEQWQQQRREGWAVSLVASMQQTLSAFGMEEPSTDGLQRFICEVVPSLCEEARNTIRSIFEVHSFGVAQKVSSAELRCAFNSARREFESRFDWAQSLAPLNSRQMRGEAEAAPSDSREHVLFAQVICSSSFRKLVISHADHLVGRFCGVDDNAAGNRHVSPLDGFARIIQQSKSFAAERDAALMLHIAVGLVDHAEKLFEYVDASSPPLTRTFCKELVSAIPSVT